MHTKALSLLSVYTGRTSQGSFHILLRLVSGINFLVLSVNLISAPLSLSFLFMLLPLLLTLPTHHSDHPQFPLSFTPGSRPTSSTNLSPTDSLPASGLTPRTSRLDRFFWASPFYVVNFFSILFCLVPCGRLSWLLVSFWAHVNIVHHNHISYISPPPKRRTTPIIGPCLLWPNGWMDQDSTWHGGRPRPQPHCVRWGPSSSPSKKVSQQPHHFLAHVYCDQTAGWIKIPLGTEISFGPDHVVIDGDPAPPTELGTAAPTFRSMSMWPNGRPSQQLLSSFYIYEKNRLRTHVMTWRIFVVYRNLCAKVVGATSSNGFLVTSVEGGVQSIAMSVFVCLFVCPITYPTYQTSNLHNIFTARRNARIASAVLAIWQFRPSVRPSVRLSVCHTPDKWWWWW